VAPASLSLTDVAIERLWESAEAFAHLTFPRYRSLLAAGHDGIIVFGASQGFRAIGLALASCSDGEKDARLLSLVVDDSEWRRGVGGSLLRACQHALAENRCRAIVAYHSSRLPGAFAFQSTLRSCGWDEAELSEVRSVGRCGALAEAIAKWPGVGRLLRNSAYSFAPWAELTAADRPAIERLSAEPLCSPYLSPDSWTGLIDSRISIAVRKHGEVVGWVLLSPDSQDPRRLLHCESAYIRHDLWHTGALVGGFLQGYRAVADHFGPDAVVRFHTVPRLPGMVALVRRRFAPVSLWVDDWLVSRKRLAG